jgi:hypothetical protein
MKKWIVGFLFAGLVGCYNLQAQTAVTNANQGKGPASVSTDNSGTGSSFKPCVQVTGNAACCKNKSAAADNKGCCAKPAGCSGKCANKSASCAGKDQDKTKTCQQPCKGKCSSKCAGRPKP